MQTNPHRRAAAGNAEGGRAKRETVKLMGLNDEIEDLRVSLGQQSCAGTGAAACGGSPAPR